MTANYSKIFEAGCDRVARCAFCVGKRRTIFINNTYIYRYMVYIYTIYVVCVECTNCRKRTTATRGAAATSAAAAAAAAASPSPAAFAEISRAAQFFSHLTAVGARQAHYVP